MEKAMKNKSKGEGKRTLNYAPSDPAREMKLMQEVREIEKKRKQHLL
jgi:hypothetical protein